jgi:thioredoxin reductase (NADPH)
MSKQTMDEILDAFVVGAGPIGLACGIEAEKRNLKYVIADKGCLVNSLYHYPYNMTFFSTSDRLEIGGVPFISHGNKPNRAEALEYYRRVASSWKLRLKLYERVLSIEDLQGCYQITTDRAGYKARSIVIATGFYDLPYLLNVQGEKLPKVKHYYDEPHPYYDQKIIVVGAANSGVDVALETYRKGAHVTMVLRETEISPSVKYWVKPDIENRIKEGSIKAYFNSNISEIREHEVDLITPDGALTLENDFVLAMTGYQPDFKFLTSTGIKLNNNAIKSPVYNTDTHETNQHDIYLAGVICGGLQTNKWFIENSREHALKIFDTIKNRLN